MGFVAASGVLETLEPLRFRLALRNKGYMKKTTYKFKKAIQVACNYHPHLHLDFSPQGMWR